MLNENTPKNLNDEGGYLEKFNNRLWRSFSGLLDPKYVKKGELSIRGSRGKTLKPTDDVRMSLLSGSTEWAETFKSKVTEVLSDLDDEVMLGARIMDQERFMDESQQRWHRLYGRDATQDEAFTLWIASQGEQHEGLWKKTKGLYSYFMREIGITSKIGVMGLGLGISKVHSKSGELLLNYPALLQMSSDISEVYSSDAVLKNKSGDSVVDASPNGEVKKILDKYDVNKVPEGVVTHHNFAERIRDSAAMNIGLYTWPRQLIGWAAYGLILSNPDFRSYVDTNPIDVNMITYSALGGAAALRIGLDCLVLNKVGYSPDIVETSVSLLSGKVDKKQQLKANWTAGVLGTPIDIAGSLLPPYGVALMANPPYSMDAYLLAMAVDQGVFMALNGGFLLRQMRKEKNNGN